MSKSVKEKYDEFYSPLVDKLPMMDAKFMASLTSAGLFSEGNLKDEVQAERTSAARATTFLDSAISPYIQEDDVELEPLYKLLKAMEKHGGIAKRLAEKIKTAIPYNESNGANGGPNDEPSMYSNKILVLGRMVEHLFVKQPSTNVLFYQPSLTMEITIKI